MASGPPAPVRRLAAALREKLWTRVSEGAVTVSAATVLDDEITALARSPGTASHRRHLAPAAGTPTGQPASVKEKDQ